MIEQTIAENTAAIKEQTTAILKLASTIAGGASASWGADIATPEDAQITTTAAAQVKPKAEKQKAEKLKPTVVTEPEPEPEPELDEDSEEKEVAKLPAGKRDEAFYIKYVRPTLAALMELDQAEMGKLIQKEFGVDRGQPQVKKGLQVPPEQWDELVSRAKEIISGIKAVDALL